MLTKLLLYYLIISKIYEAYLRNQKNILPSSLRKLPVISFYILFEAVKKQLRDIQLIVLIFVMIKSAIQ